MLFDLLHKWLASLANNRLMQPFLEQLQDVVCFVACFMQPFLEQLQDVEMNGLKKRHRLEKTA
jgi:hypothetical protein